MLRRNGVPLIARRQARGADRCRPAYPPIHGDGAAWVSWIGGVALVMLAGAAYIADEAGAVTETERIKALAWVADHMTPAFGEIRRWHRQACGGTSRA
jgi:hypothetical protein